MSVCVILYVDVKDFVNGMVGIKWHMIFLRLGEKVNNQSQQLNVGLTALWEE